jgi:hypothetical protein
MVENAVIYVLNECLGYPNFASKINKSKKMIKKNLVFCVILFINNLAFSQSAEAVKILQISKDKWKWMADKEVGKLDKLFHAQSKFVHMSGTWMKAEELEIIKTGSIWYKEAKVKDTAIELVGKTATIWNRITLVAVVRGNEVTTEFTVTEVYQKIKKNWQMLALTFSSVRDTHEIKK